MLCWAPMAQVLEAPVLQRIVLPRDNFLLELEAPSMAPEIRPGQFVMAAPCDGLSLPNPLLKRALAVYSVAGKDGAPSRIRLLLKVVGDGTRRLANAHPGSILGLVGPLGNGFDLEAGKGRINLILAGGIGIASVLLLAEQLARAGEVVELLYGARSERDLVGISDFEKLDIPVLVTTEDGSRGEKGLITEGLKRCLERFPREHLNLYTCGPNPMMQAVSRLAVEHGIPCQISVETKMACGFGVCLGCSIKTLDSYRLACTHGPVFQAETFVWEGENPSSEDTLRGQAGSASSRKRTGLSHG